MCSITIGITMEYLRNIRIVECTQLLELIRTSKTDYQTREPTPY